MQPASTYSDVEQPFQNKAVFISNLKHYILALSGSYGKAKFALTFLPPLERNWGEQVSSAVDLLGHHIQAVADQGENGSKQGKACEWLQQ